MSQWKDIKLKDLCVKVTVGYVGPMAHEYRDAGVTFLRSLNIKPFRLELTDVKFISDEFHHRIRKSTLRPGDVAVVRTGYPGTAAVVPTSLPVSNCSDLVIVRPGKNLNPHFITAIFNSTFGQTLVSGNTVGAAQQHFNITVAKELRFRVPPKPVQDKIAAILSAYDELIENNRRRIVLLEKLAEEIYREWFIRLRFPGHEGVKVVKRVPSGWTFDKASKFFGLVKGKSYAGDEITDDPEHMPFISLKSFNRGGGYREDGLKYYSGRYKDEQVVRQNDIVVALTDMTQDRAVVGRAARIPNLGERGAVISLDAVKLVPNNINSTFLYAYMRHSGFADFIKEFANGANVLHLKPELITKQKIIIPPRSLQDEFMPKAAPLYAQMDLLAEANQRLNLMRDRLLPRLISGKLSVENLDIKFPPGVAEELRAETTH